MSALSHLAPTHASVILRYLHIWLVRHTWKFWQLRKALPSGSIERTAGRRPKRSCAPESSKIQPGNGIADVYSALLSAHAITT